MSKEISFKVKDLYQGALPEQSLAEKQAYYDSYIAANKRRTLLNDKLSDLTKVTQSLEVASLKLTSDYGDLLKDIHKVQQGLYDLRTELNGNPAKNTVGEKTKPNLNSRLSAAGAPIWGSTYGPTQTSKESLALAEKMLAEYEVELAALEVEVAAIEVSIQEKGGVIIRHRE